MDNAPPPDLTRWQAVVERVKNPEGEVRIAVVGKYMQVKDSYKSLSEALAHGGLANNVRVHLDWIDSEVFERDDAASFLENVSGILVPGGFGERGTEGKIEAVKFAREKKVPFFGICYGLHMAVIEAARDLAGLEGAGTTEIGQPKHPVIGLMTEWTKGNEMETRSADGDMGGTMRLGAYPAVLTPGSRVAEIYGETEISERHRHRYEVNINYAKELAKHGMEVSGWSPDGSLPEIMEIPGPSLVHRRAVPSRTEIAATGAASAVHQLHRGGGAEEPAGLTLFSVRHRDVTGRMRHGAARGRQMRLRLLQLLGLELLQIAVRLIGLVADGLVMLLLQFLRRWRQGLGQRRKRAEKAKNAANRGQSHHPTSISGGALACRVKSSLTRWGQDVALR